MPRGLHAARASAASRAAAALWPLDVDGRQVDVAVLSMGNPHAVQHRRSDVDVARRSNRSAR